MDLPRPHVVAVIRETLAQLRHEETPTDLDAVVARAATRLTDLARTRLQPVINGTGVMLHTNFGRAPLSDAAVAAIGAAAANFANLEFDLGAGERGGRAGYLERSLALLCESGAATVVNNCAAGLVLIVRHFTAGRREVVISRGELVQIGGGFRVPDLLTSSGATLREVGTTNQTSLEDYGRGIGPDTGLILKVHRSNFHMEGFVASPRTEAIAALARERGIPFVEDLGSGAPVATEEIAGLEHEPTPAEVLARGVDLVTFSGDKLLGGPQAGIIAGTAAHVAALKRDPVFRALRCDKLVLAGLEATVEAYLRQRTDTLPLQVMLRTPIGELRARAEAIVRAIGDPRGKVGVCETMAEVGGGCLPRSTVTSVALECAPDGLAVGELARRLRHGRPAVIGTIAHGRFRLDLRTIFPRQDALVSRALAGALARP